MIKNTFKLIEKHCGSQRAAAAWLHIALSTYQLWKKRGDDLAEKHKQYLLLKVDEIDV